MCVMCLKKDAKRHMEKSRKNGALPRYMFGDGYHCLICGKDVTNGKKMCDKCYGNSVRTSKIARAHIKNGWASQNFVFGKTAKETKEPERKRKEMLK